MQKTKIANFAMTNVNYFIFIYFQEQKSVKPHTSVEVSTEDTSTEPQTVSVYDNVYSYAYNMCMNITLWYYGSIVHLVVYPSVQAKASKRDLSQKEDI